MGPLDGAAGLALALMTEGSAFLSFHTMAMVEGNPLLL